MERERKIKLWLWSIVKILAILYFAVKLSVLVFEKMGWVNSSEEIKKTNLETAKLEIEDNVFSWDENNRKAILRIINHSNVEAKNIDIKAYAHFEASTDFIKFDKGNFINPNSFAALESTLEGLPIGQLPDSITVCLTHESEHTNLKTWYQFVLKGLIGGLSNPMFQHATYKTKLLAKEYFDDEAPSCFQNSESLNLTSEITRTIRLDSLKQLTEIKEVAELFLNGLNLRAFPLVKKYASKNLFDHLNSMDKNFKYTFNTTASIIKHDEGTAYLKIFLTSEGWSEYLNRGLINRINNINKNPDSFFDFLDSKDNVWIGKLKKEESIWKFVAHENSPFGKKN